jgi:transposase
LAHSSGVNAARISPIAEQMVSTRLGHAVRLIAPAYFKPFAKRQKNDVADAEAICEAAQRPAMRFVGVKE